MKLIKIDNVHALAALLGRRRGDFPPDAYYALRSAVALRFFDEAIGILRTAAVLWRFEAKRTGDRDLYRAAKTAFDTAECKQVIVAGEDL